MDVEALIRRYRDALSPAERRVADVVLSDPRGVAFGTVATTAKAAATSGASVVRLTTRLGLDGFAELQDRVRDDLTRDLHRAAERIRQPQPQDLLDRAAALAAETVTATLGGIDRDDFAAAVAMLGDRTASVFVVASDDSRGIADQFVTELAMLRPRVRQVQGSSVAVWRDLADLVERDVVVTFDVPRYDRWLVAASEHAAEQRARLIALTNSPLSPLARHATISLTVASASAGPFDSHVAALAVFEALVAGVAGADQHGAAERLAQIDAAWTAGDVFTDP